MDTPGSPPSPPACAFCDPARLEILFETPLVLAVPDRRPVSPGHTLLILRRHAPTFFEATPGEQAALLEALGELKRRLDARYRPQGYNIGVNCGAAAGQTVPHLHVHLIPRYRGDSPRPAGGVRHVLDPNP